MGALIVGFEATTLFVYSTNSNSLEELNSMVNLGGAPVGIARATKTADGIELVIRPLAEFSDDDHIYRYLSDLAEGLRQQFVRVLGEN